MKMVSLRKRSLLFLSVVSFTTFRLVYIHDFSSMPLGTVVAHRHTLIGVRCIHPTALLAHARDMAIMHSNAAFCYKQAGQHRMAIYQCTHALAYDPEYWKAAFRRGEALEELGYFSEAVASFKR